MSDQNTDLEQLIKKMKQFRFEFVMAVIGLIVILAGIFLFLQQTAKSSTDEIEIVSTDTPQQNSQEIVIDVGGAVNKPGVYRISSNSRTGEAIEKAGGLTASADQTWIAKNVNLAAKLTDGAKIYIPLAGETTASVAGTATSNLQTAAKININAGSQAELESLPAIGPVTAQKIISARPFSTVEELLSKKVVSKSTFEKIKDLVTTF